MSSRQFLLLGDRHHEFLIAMISLTISRISSRADSPSSFGELGKVDCFDQGAEDGRF